MTTLMGQVVGFEYRRVRVRRPVRVQGAARAPEVDKGRDIQVRVVRGIPLDAEAQVRVPAKSRPVGEQGVERPGHRVEVPDVEGGGVVHVEQVVRRVGRGREGGRRRGDGAGRRDRVLGVVGDRVEHVEVGVGEGERVVHDALERVGVRVEDVRSADRLPRPRVRHLGGEPTVRHRRRRAGPRSANQRGALGDTGPLERVGERVRDPRGRAAVGEVLVDVDEGGPAVGHRVLELVERRGADVGRGQDGREVVGAARQQELVLDAVRVTRHLEQVERGDRVRDLDGGQRGVVDEVRVVHVGAP